MIRFNCAIHVYVRLGGMCVGCGVLDGVADHRKEEATVQVHVGVVLLI